MALGTTCDGLVSHPGEVETLPVVSHYTNRRAALELMNFLACPITTGARFTLGKPKQLNIQAGKEEN